MAFNLMKDAVGYTKKKCQETNLICKFSTTINGTLQIGLSTLRTAGLCNKEVTGYDRAF